MVNPSNPAISRHVERRQPHIAQEKNIVEEKKKKKQAKVNFFLVRSHFAVSRKN